MDQANASKSRVAAIATKMDLTFLLLLSESPKKVYKQIGKCLIVPTYCEHFSNK